jgi:hypothetical protein
MMRFPKTLLAWDTPEFRAIFLAELTQFGPGVLPLQQGLEHSSYALEDDIRLVVVGMEQAGDAIHVQVGIFYTGLVPGCSCADDPTPVEPQNEYCEARVIIDRASGEAVISLVED